jgi:hypothetical protein
MERAKYISPAGEPDKDMLVRKLSSSGFKFENLEELIDRCVLLKGADQCETAYNIFECYWSARIAPTASKYSSVTQLISNVILRKLLPLAITM